MNISKYKQNKLVIEGDLVNYYTACAVLAHDFRNKYFKGNADLDWVGEPGGVLMINDFYFGMDDIITALKKKVTIKKLFEWYDYYTEPTPRAMPKVNFNGWLKGMR
jgi:hypothetical protein